MIVYRDLDSIVRDPDNVLTVGTFDGVHVGHRFIIQNLLAAAKRSDGIPTLITFYPHPQLVVARKDKPSIGLLISLDQKIELLRELGIEKLVIIPFTREFARLSSVDYVRNILDARIGFKGIVIGYDHAFGRDREGSVHTLRELAREKGFFIEHVPPFKANGEVVSSTVIRRLLLAGELEKANRYLARPYSFRARVVRGAGRGRSIGFPTANLELLEPHMLVPARGVYAVKVELDDEWLVGMGNIGVRPTFNGAHETVEIHLLNFDADIYEKTVEVYFHHRLRSEKKFNSVEELIQQLHEDKKQTKNLFKQAHPNQVELEDEHAIDKR
jgi:riboflavin kinase/FMN adenylyltransferase